MREYEKLYEEDNSHVRTITQPVGIFYAILLFGSAILSLILFEDLIKVPIYFVYSIVALLISVSCMMMLHMLLRRI